MTKHFIIALLLFSAFTLQGQLKPIVPDDYPVTNEQLRIHPTIVIGEIVSLDKAWFKSNSSEDVLIFELYTDLHRLQTFHFNTKEIPEHLLNELELHTLVNNAYMTIGLNEKKIHVTEFADSAKIVDASYFDTKKGFSIGTKKEMFLECYGDPAQCFNAEAYEICIWRFDGDRNDAGTNPGKPLAENSFGYNVTAYFKERKLIAMILFNNIP